MMFETTVRFANNIITNLKMEGSSKRIRLPSFEKIDIILLQLQLWQHVEIPILAVALYRIIHVMTWNPTLTTTPCGITHLMT